MHLREKADQLEEEDDDVIQEIDSNDVLVDSQAKNFKILYLLIDLVLHRAA